MTTLLNALQWVALALAIFKTVLLMLGIHRNAENSKEYSYADLPLANVHLTGMLWFMTAVLHYLATT
jgi:hypothetical protein